MQLVQEECGLAHMPGFLAGVTQAMMKGKSDSFPWSLPTSVLSLVTEHPGHGVVWQMAWDIARFSHASAFYLCVLMLPPLSPSSLSKITEGNIISLFCFFFFLIPILKQLGIKLEAM